MGLPCGDSIADRELVERCVHPSGPADRKRASTAIYERHHDAVLRFCSVQLRERDSALDAAHDTFEAALAELYRGKPPRRPDNLRAWLLGFARHRCFAYMRGGRSGVGGRRGLDMLAPDDELVGGASEDDYESSSRARQAEVDRLLGVVLATFTENQRRIYELGVSQGLTGKRLAEELGVNAAQASRLAGEIRREAFRGFGALVLARAGRPNCPALARLLDEAAWDGEQFTARLRLRVGRHFDDCPECDKCATCATRRKQLVGPLAPALIPVLFAPELRDRVMETVDRLAGRDEAGSDDEDERGSSGIDERPDEQSDERSGRRRRALVGAVVALITLVAGAFAVTRVVADEFRTVSLTITVATNVARVTDVPGAHQSNCATPQGNATRCTSVTSISKGKASPIRVTQAAGSTSSMRYFGCDDRSPNGSPSCVVTANGPREICITTDDPLDAANVAECRARVS